MRTRSIAAAVLVAAGVAVTTTGMAAAGEPDGGPAEVIMITCENGEPVVVEPTEEELEQLEAEGFVAGETRPLPRGGVELVVPAEPGEELPPEAVCDELVAGGVAAGTV